MDKQITFDKKEDLPLVTSSFESMAWNKTGDWRYLKPIFQDKTPPCNNSCPAGEDVQGYLYLVQKKRYKEAWSLIKEENPLPAVCGRACMHPCEDFCNRGEFDEPINISAVERFLADHAMKRGYILSPIKRKEKKEKIAIIGSGPAGLSCAYQLRRMGYHITLFEALPVLGGILRIGIPDYRLPKYILEHEIDTILGLGIQIQTKARIDRETITKDMKDFQAIFIATGSHISTRLGIAGEDSGSVMSGLDFLKDIHLGKKVPLGKKVAVIGGGNTAIDAARLVLRLGAKPFILYRRTPGEMPAIKSEVIQAEKEGIEISYLISLTRIVPQGDRVITLECVKNRSGPPDASGKKTLIEIKDSHFQIEADNIISAIGEVPDISILPQEIDVKNQLIVTDESLETTMNGIFAGGDVKSPLRSIAHAIGSGKRAAISIDRYLKAKTLEDVMDTIRIGDGPSLSMRSYLKRDDPSRRKSKEVVRFRDINIDYFEQSSRHAVQTLSIDQSISSNKEVHLGFPCETALQEANRCFSCGVCNHCDNCYLFCSDLAVIKQKGKIRNTIDYDHCKGCGVCAEECPRDCIYMEREEK